MPQMAPISWLILFILFSITFMMFNSLNYYNFPSNNSKNNNQETSNNNSSNNFLTWKW